MQKIPSLKKLTGKKRFAIYIWNNDSRSSTFVVDEYNDLAKALKAEAKYNEMDVLAVMNGNKKEEVSYFEVDAQNNNIFWDFTPEEVHLWCNNNWGYARDIDIVIDNFYFHITTNENKKIVVVDWSYENESSIEISLEQEFDSVREAITELKKELAAIGKKLLESSVSDNIFFNER